MRIVQGDRLRMVGPEPAVCHVSNGNIDKYITASATAKTEMDPASAERRSIR